MWFINNSVHLIGLMFFIIVVYEWYFNKVHRSKHLQKTDIMPLYIKLKRIQNEK